MLPRRRIRAVAAGSAVALFVAVSSSGYTVQRGDTLGGIAHQYETSVSELAALNGIDDPDLIVAGQVLSLPEQAADGRTHTVAAGETLGRIAARHGVPASGLADGNGLADPNLIFPGQKLQIPAATSGAASAAAGGGYSRSGQFHIVETGESLASIAAGHEGVSAEDIARANGITDGVLYAGTRLFLDGPALVGGEATGVTQHRVEAGDNLSALATWYGTSIGDILAGNSIPDPDVIRVGQTLSIPGAGSWVCPLESPSYFNDWGFPRGTDRYHEGNDLFAGDDQPVRAPVSGRVEYVVGSIGGYQFNLYGDDGIEYVGSHMSGFEGSDRRVEAGEVLGYVGTSGNARGTRPHTHFGMYVDELAFNPYPTLAANCR